MADHAEVVDEEAKVEMTPEQTLGELFDRLKIRKIVLVDDKAEIQVDAGSIVKALADTIDAGERLAPYFPGVNLTLENDALLEQLTSKLDEFDIDQMHEFQAALATGADDAAEREVFGSLGELIPDEIEIQLLTPVAWHESRAQLIENCQLDNRTLFLFDQELDVTDPDLNFTKGSDIIKDLAEKEKAGFGTRWFCGILSHTLKTGTEIETWKKLQEDENIDLRFFMPIAKDSLQSAPAFYGSVYRTLINTYCSSMKTLAAQAFGAALKEALQRFEDLDPIDFEHVVVKSSETEGVSELETLMRLYGIIQKDRVKAQILQDATIGEFTIAARAAKEIADVARSLSSGAQKRLHMLRNEELYEDDKLVNGYHEPLRNGDLFEIGEGDQMKMWVLIGQPCDLMVRKDGKRVREESFKVAVLAPVKTRPLGCDEVTRGALGFSLDHFDHGGAQSGQVAFADGTPANLQVLDLAVLSKDGRCHIGTTPAPDARFASRSWEERASLIYKNFGKVRKQIEDVRAKHSDTVAALIAPAVLPRVSPSKSLTRYGNYEDGKFIYPIRRFGRIRDPLAGALLSAYSRFLSRDAFEHDYSRA